MRFRHFVFWVLAGLLVATPSFAQKAPEMAEGRSCDEPLLWMAEYGTKDFARPYCEACLPGRALDGEHGCVERIRAKGQLEIAKPFIKQKEAETQVSLTSCERTDFQHQLLRAWYGRGVRTRWKPHFERMYEWFGKRARASYPKPAVELIEHLEQSQKQCAEIESTYAKFLRPIQRARATGKIGHRIATEHESWEQGVGTSDRALWTGHGHGTGVWLTVMDEPKTLGDVFLDRNEAKPGEVEAFNFEPGLSNWWKAQKYVATVSLSQRDSDFRCYGECEGGYMIHFYLNESGKVIGQYASFSACPFVYTTPADTESWVLQGEILRNLHRPDMERGQTLAIVGEGAACEDGAVRVRVTEEKDEVTYLDDVSLFIDGQQIKPSQCRIGEVSHCSDDGDYTVLTEGEFIDLLFEIPDDARASCSELTLWADGFYVPLSGTRSSHEDRGPR